jgi:hypothetical protein
MHTLDIVTSDGKRATAEISHAALSDPDVDAVGEAVVDRLLDVYDSLLEPAQSSSDKHAVLQAVNS